MCGRCHENLEQATDAIPFYEQLVALRQKDKHVDKAFQRLAFLYDGDNLTTLINNYRSEFPDGEFGDIMLLKAAEVSFSEGQIDDAVSKYQALADKELTEEMRESVIYGLVFVVEHHRKIFVFGSHGRKLDQLSAANINPRHVFSAGKDCNGKRRRFHCPA